MSIEPTHTTDSLQTTESQSTTTPPSTESRSTVAPSATEIATRQKDDPWAAPGETPTDSVAERSPRQFEPGCRRRLRNLMDDENAYCE